MNPAATANGLPADYHQVHGHPLHVPHQSQNGEHWPQMLPQNQHQQFRGPPQPIPFPSALQMQAQGYPNPPQYLQHYNSPSFDLSSIIPQHIMRDFLRLSTPVGSSPNDDTILAQALYESKQTGKTYRQALEGLHGVNNHAANLWKDYYLDHHDRFRILVSRLAEQPKTVKKPVILDESPPPVKQESSSPQVARKRHLSPPSLFPDQTTKKMGRTTAPSQTSRQKRAAPQAATSTISVLARPPKRPRATLNSLSAPLPSSNVPNLMPPQVDIPVPAPPSRSPTPPGIVQIGTNGNRYTKEDREYFLEFLLWRLKQDPFLTKRQLCELLHEKAPHHSATSWASHWHQRHDIADKILATYNNYSKVDTEDDEDQQNEDEVTKADEEVKHDDYDDTQSEAMSATENSRHQRGTRHSEVIFPDFIDTDVDTEEDERDMGEPGSSFTRGDWCILARFIARNHWDEMSPKRRWQVFTETYSTKRPAKSWAEFYRKHEAAVLKLSNMYLLSSGRESRRRGGPSWQNVRKVSQEFDLDEDGEHEIDWEQLSATAT